MASITETILYCQNCGTEIGVHYERTYDLDTYGGDYSEVYEGCTDEFCAECIAEIEENEEDDEFID